MGHSSGRSVRLLATDVNRGGNGQAAVRLGTESDLGTLEPGKYVDVIATGGGPLEDISVVKRVTFLMKNGEIYKHE